MKKLLSVLLVLTMLIGVAASLAACTDEPAEEVTTESTTTNAETTAAEETSSKEEASASEETSAEDSSSEEDESSATDETSDTDESTAAEENSSEDVSETEETTDPEIDPDGYENGDAVDGAGIVWEDEEFLMTDYTVDESKAVKKTAEEVLALLKDKTALKGNEIYLVEQPLKLAADTKYYGNLATVIAKGGVIVENVQDVVVKELIIKGSITVTNSSGIVFFKLDLQGDKTGFTVDNKSTDISLKTCKVSATETAITSGAEDLTVFKSHLSADKCVVSTGDKLDIQNTKLIAGACAVSTSGTSCIVKGNDITANKDGVGVEYGAGSVNGLVALNNIKDVQISVKMTEGYNCVVLLNSAIRVQIEKSTNIYVNENKLGGAIELTGIKYLLCNNNTFPEDGRQHPIITTACSEFNGNNIQDLSVRAQAGVNEDLLPHTNKDLFLGMEKQVKVYDASQTKSYAFSSYIQKMAKTPGSVVIIPPGAYTTTSTAYLNQDDTTLYAYGVYQEKKSIPDGETDPVSSDPDAILREKMDRNLVISAKNISVYGLTTGYDFQSSGQAYVLEKLTYNDKNCIRVISAAGYIDGITYTDPRIFDPNQSISIIHKNQDAAWVRSLAHTVMTNESNEMINEDGTMIIHIGDAKIYKEIQAGDVLGCRLASGNTDTVYITGEDIYLEDCVIYGHSAALSITAEGRDAKNMQLHRVHNTVHSNPIIDKDTYKKYAALEKQYGLDGEDDNGLEIFIDENGRYRGSRPRFGSVDGVHLRNCGTGVSATSSIFENMVDDATNQRGDTARIAGYKDNGDGTSTIYWKGSIAPNYHTLAINSKHTETYPRETAQFKKGDTIYAYAYGGEVLIEARVLEDNVRVTNETLPTDVHLFHTDANKDCVCDNTSCNAILHSDHKDGTGSTLQFDCKCDTCGKAMHAFRQPSHVSSGYMESNYCNHCGKEIVDANNDGYNDSDNAFICRDMASPATFSNDLLKWYMPTYHWEGNYDMLYNSAIYAVKVKTSDVNVAALEGYDLTDNDYFMEEKVLCDNLSAGSTGFTFDNVLMRNYNSRGILNKSSNTVIKNCTLQNVGMTGVLLSIESHWGESSTPSNAVITNNVFDNIGCARDYEKSPTYAAIAIQGFGDFDVDVEELDPDHLPCKNITITGNRFINTNNYYVIAVDSAQNVTIKDNYIEGRQGERSDLQLAKAFLIDNCIDIELSNNTYVGFKNPITDETKTLSEMMNAKNYINLHGTDLEGTDVPADKLPEDAE